MYSRKSTRIHEHRNTREGSRVIVAGCRMLRRVLEVAEVTGTVNPQTIDEKGLCNG